MLYWWCGDSARRMTITKCFRAVIKIKKISLCLEHRGFFSVFLRDLYSKAWYVSKTAPGMLSRPTVHLFIVRSVIGELEKLTGNLAEISNGFVHYKQFFLLVFTQSLS